jgi:LuxR family transcriptional regulator, maltose regulon positive regulatory protein
MGYGAPGRARTTVGPDHGPGRDPRQGRDHGAKEVTVPGPLLATKLHTPRPRRVLVPRPRLDALLDQAWSSTLTLVAGPAGFGKTTLLADWSSRVADRRAAAWLSLDERDTEPSSFWTYVIGSLRTVVPDVGIAALDLLRDPHVPAEAALESLLNDLQSDGTDVVLVLDDYHLVQSPAVHQDMAFVLDHLPASAHVVIATRADPALPLARLRARGELAEVRAGDLRFTAAEAGEYLREAMGLALDEDQVTALDQRTEGWIAALQLAALSMQGRTDVGEFIAAFSGDDRYLVDYLVEEVLQRQSEPVRRFLLETSILDRLSGPLCDAVTGGDTGRSTLELLDRQNLFVVPLDDHRRWYRYHHLFADVLRARLLDEHPERIRVLQRRASAWFAEHDQPAEAVEHAVRGQDFVRAAELVEQALPTMRRDRREGELRSWLEALPGELVAQSPVLTVATVGALMAQGELAGVDVRLQAAERWLEAHADDPRILDEPLRTVASNVAMYRAGQARLLGDVPATIEHAQRAHDLSSDADHLERGAAAALLGLARWSNGQLEDARRGYLEALRHLSAAGHLSDVLGCTLALSDMEVARGDLNAAFEVLRQGLRSGQEAPHPPRGLADMHVGLAALHVERNELDAALEHLAAGDELGEHAGLPQNAYRSRVALAQLRLAQDAADQALTLLADAERLHNNDFSPDVHPVPALIARASLARGRIGQAERWARSRGLTVDDELSYLKEFEHLTLARLLLCKAQSGGDPAPSGLGGFLSRLLGAAEDERRPGSALQVLVLQALHAHTRGQDSQARSLLAEAVRRAEPQQYARAITEHGPPVLTLLRSLLNQRPSSYIRHLLDSAEPPSLAPALPSQPLPDRLSDREIEVLQLLASDLGGPDIARALVVSVHTVRTHTKAIYSKLGVNNRRAAVSRARELALLHRSA